MKQLQRALMAVLLHRIHEIDAATIKTKCYLELRNLRRTRRGLGRVFLALLEKKMPG